MMDTTTCSTIVLVLLWLTLCLQALGSLVTLLEDYNGAVLYSTITVSTLLLGLCLWQCKNAGYLVSPLTWYHWALLVLLVILQIVAVVLVQQEQKAFYLLNFLLGGDINPIYAVAVVLTAILVLLGGTLYCGWKCNLFCRPCCKSQYICYGSAILVVLVILTVLALTAALLRYDTRTYRAEGQTDLLIISHLDKILVPITQCYSMAVLWNTFLKIPYTLPEVVALVSSAGALATLLALVVAVSDGTQHRGKQQNTKGYPFLAVHLLSLGITFYLLEYKATFCCPKQYLCFGLLSMVLIIALVEYCIANSPRVKEKVGVNKYILLGYSIVLMVPVFWYAYRCDLFTWRWNSCVPKKKNLKATDTAKNTIPDNDIAKES